MMPTEHDALPARESSTVDPLVTSRPLNRYAEDTAALPRSLMACPRPKEEARRPRKRCVGQRSALGNEGRPPDQGLVLYRRRCRNYESRREKSTSDVKLELRL